MSKLHCFEVHIGKSREDIEIFLNKTKKELDSFFNLNVPTPYCFLVSSRKQFNEIWAEKTKDWQVAWADGNNIFIIKPEKYTQESSHKDASNFWKVIKHEDVHIYYRQLSGGINKPKWLNEGLAKHLAEQKFEKPDRLGALNVLNYHDKSDENIFPLGTYWVKYLIDEFGRERLLKLIKLLNNNGSEVHFKNVFREIYNFNFHKEELARRYK